MRITADIIDEEMASGGSAVNKEEQSEACTEEKKQAENENETEMIFISYSDLETVKREYMKKTVCNPLDEQSEACTEEQKQAENEVDFEIIIPSRDAEIAERGNCERTSEYMKKLKLNGPIHFEEPYEEIRPYTEEEEQPAIFSLSDFIVISGSEMEAAKQEYMKKMKYGKPQCWLRRRDSHEAGGKDPQHSSKYPSIFPVAAAVFDKNAKDTIIYDVQETPKIRDMCNKFQELNVSGDPAFLQNVRKSCEYSRSKMEERSEASAEEKKQAENENRTENIFISFCDFETAKREFMNETVCNPLDEQFEACAEEQKQDENDVDFDIIIPWSDAELAERVYHERHMKKIELNGTLQYEQIEPCTEEKELPEVSNENEIIYISGSEMEAAKREYMKKMKYCKPQCWLKQSDSHEAGKKHPQQSSKFPSIFPVAAAVFDKNAKDTIIYDGQETPKIRDMCNKFQELKLSGDPAFLENVRKSCECSRSKMVCKSEYKMDEAKANDPKTGIDLETPPAWMIEFLLKMKQEIKDEIMEELSNLPRIEIQGLSSNEKDGSQLQGDVIHPGIFCDNCDQLIHGVRYKCGNCSDFDLCQECESLPNIHNKNHIFLKIRYPVALKLYQKQKGQPLIIPNAGDILACSSKISNHQPKKMYEARFLWDETIPDGTVVAPSTRFVKSWRVMNSGKRVWTHCTKLQHVQGSAGLIPASAQVDVPHLRPGEEGIVSVFFTAPSVPGVYRSHWNFCHKSRPFGHIVWCHINVEEPEKHAENACQTMQLPPDGLPDEKQEVASIAQVLTAVKEEHERGNMIPRKLAVNSHTATPNNTPFDLTPPKSPDHQAMNELKEVSEDKESTNSKQNADFDAEDDGSVVSLSSSESDAEFVVIPMPKCFNLSESFSSQHIPNLSQYLQPETVGDLKSSEHKIMKPQSINLKPAVNAETVSQETGVPELSAHGESNKEGEQKIFISHNVSADGSSSEISIIESGESSPTDEHVMPEISSIRIAVTSDMKPKPNEVTDEGNVQKVEDSEKEESSSDAQPSSATFPKFPVEGITSVYEYASSSNAEERTVQVLPERLVTAPLSAAATIYKTAKGVISSFQQGGAYGRASSVPASLNPMDQLVEMGFCSRQQNEELLRKHKNDVALVVAELVSMNDNDWYASRHVPPSPPEYFN